MLAIHDSRVGFHPYWMDYCQQNKIPFRPVKCYRTDVISQLQGCDALMWHHNHISPRDMLVAKQILFALEHSGLKVFPNFRTGWHFDDKVAQKYLFEALGVQAIPSWVFVDLVEAMEWAASTSYPKVFKLRKGAGSANVRLVESRAQAESLIRRAFGRGFSSYSAWGSLKERAYKYRIGQAGLLEVAKGLARFAVPPRFATIVGRETGYAYFQEFVPGNDSDIRVIVIGDRAFAIKRMTRPGDFRASGSGNILYDPREIDPVCIKLAFDINAKIRSDCLACDFVFDSSSTPLLIEVSYGFSQPGYDRCPGFWTDNLNYKEEPFDPQGWMVETLFNKISLAPG